MTQEGKYWSKIKKGLEKNLNPINSYFYVFE